MSDRRLAETEGYVWYGVGWGRPDETGVLVREADVSHLDGDILLGGNVYLKATDEWVDGACVHERVRPDKAMRG